MPTARDPEGVWVYPPARPSVAPAATVTLPALTTWPLMTDGPPTPGSIVTLPSAALARAPALMASVSP